MEEKIGTRLCLSGSAEELIAQYTGLGQVLSQLDYPEPDVRVKGVQSRDEKINNNITVRIYTPREEGPASERFPVGVYHHAGGFLLGNLDSDDELCRQLVAHARCVIVSVDYRLGPKNKLPVMIDDGINAYDWVSERISFFFALLPCFPPSLPHVQKD